MIKYIGALIRGYITIYEEDLTVLNHPEAFFNACLSVTKRFNLRPLKLNPGLVFLLKEVIPVCRRILTDYLFHFVNIMIEREKFNLT